MEEWPEKGAREIAWLPLEQAAVRVSEPGLRELLRDFSKTHKSKQPVAAKRAG
jgi:hypothetical protein